MYIFKIDQGNSRYDVLVIVVENNPNFFLYIMFRKGH